MAIVCFSENQEKMSALKFFVYRKVEWYFTTSQKELVAIIERENIVGVILDIPYPREPDFQLIAYLKQHHKIIIMVLGVDLSSKTKYFVDKAGCDLYIADPPAVFLEKWSNFLGKMGLESKKKDIIHIAPHIHFKPIEKEVQVGTVSQKLPEMEYRMFYLFATHPGEVFTTEELLIHLWDEHTEKERVRNYIRKLRKRLGDNGKNPRYIKHEHGVGYYLKFD